MSYAYSNKCLPCLQLERYVLKKLVQEVGRRMLNMPRTRTVRSKKGKSEIATAGDYNKKSYSKYNVRNVDPGFVISFRLFPHFSLDFPSKSKTFPDPG